VAEMSLRLAMVQPRTVRPGERANLDRAVAYARRAADQGAQLVAFPECYPGPYSGPCDYSAAESLGAVAREYGICVAYGFMHPVDPAPGAPALYHNVYQVLGPDGALLARYAKTIPSPVDPELSGKQSLPGSGLIVAQTPWARVGLLICWEAWFPELCRTLAMRGADLVLFPTGGMLYHLAGVWGALIQARATENLVYTACCANLFGVEDGFAHICGPEGPLGSSLTEGVLLADLDLARLEWLRGQDETLAFPKLYKTIPGLWRHNRPDLYQPHSPLPSGERACPRESVGAG
jgi:5-aminopentanamidase